MRRAAKRGPAALEWLVGTSHGGAEEQERGNGYKRNSSGKPVDLRVAQKGCEGSGVRTGENEHRRSWRNLPTLGEWGHTLGRGPVTGPP